MKLLNETFVNLMIILLESEILYSGHSYCSVVKGCIGYWRDSHTGSIQKVAESKLTFITGSDGPFYI